MIEAIKKYFQKRKRLAEDLKYMREYEQDLLFGLTVLKQINSETIRAAQLNAYDYGFKNGDEKHGIKIKQKLWKRNQYGRYYWVYDLQVNDNLCKEFGNDETHYIFTQCKTRNEAISYICQIGKG